MFRILVSSNKFKIALLLLAWVLGQNGSGQNDMDEIVYGKNLFPKLVTILSVYYFVRIPFCPVTLAC